MTEIVKAYNEIVSVKIGQDIVSMTIAQKENQSGLKFNQRLFILVHNQFFGYISKVKLNETAEKVDINTAKVKVPIKNLYTTQTDDCLLKIQFTTQVEGKIIPKQWIFQMNTAKLAELWKQLLDCQIKNRNKNKKSSRKEQKTEKSRSLQKSQRIEKPIVKEEPKIQTDRPKKQEKKVEITTPEAAGTFDVGLFSDQSDEDNKKSKSKKKQTKQTNKASPDTAKKNSQEVDSKPKENKKPKPSLAPIQVEEPKVQKKDEKKEQIQEVKHEQRFEEKKEQKKLQNKEQTQNKLNLSRAENRLQQTTLNLPQIKQQLESQSESIKAKKQQEAVRQSHMTSKDNQQDMNFSLVKDSIFSKKKSKEQEDSLKKTNPNAHQAVKISRQKPKERQNPKEYDYQSQTSRIVVKTKEEQNVQFVKEMLNTLDEKNKKFPIEQITYNREEMSNLVNAYKDRLSTNINNKDTQHLLNTIMQTQRLKMKQSSKIQSTSQKKNKPTWLYKQIVQQQATCLVAFKTHCSQLMKQLVCEVYQNKFQKFRTIKNQNNIIELQYDDLIIKVALADRSEPKNKQFNAAEKIIKHQFKIYQYLYRIIQNRGTIRVPLACLCSYAGLTALFKVRAVFYEKDKYEQILRSQLNRLEDISCLPLKQALKGKIKPLNQFYYSQMRSGETDSNFKFHLIDDVSQIFVHDLNSQGNPSKVMRMEIIEQEISGKVLAFIPVDQIKNTSIFTKDFHVLSQKIMDRVQRVTSQLDNMDFYFVSPSELSKYMHDNGVNMRYLGKVYLKTTNQFSRSCLLSQIMARTCKKILAKTLQQSFFQERLSEKSSFESLQASLNAKMTDFMNCLLGNNHQTQAFWSIVEANAQQYYKVKLQGIQGCSKGQLLVSLAFHMNLVLKWREIDASQIFQKADFFTSLQNFEIKIKTKSYKPFKNTKVSDILCKLKDKNQLNFKFIVEQLNLKRSNFSDQVKQLQIVNQLRMYLCNFIEPQQLDWSNNFSHLSLYAIDEPTIINFRIELVAIRWFLRKGNKFKYLNKFNDLTNKLLKLYGNNHPVLSQLYQTFSDHHKSKLQIEDAINFLKTSIMNISALCGDNNQLIAQKYYNISQLLIQNKRDNEAMEYLKRAKKIVELGTQKKIVLYAKIKLLLAQLYFNEKKYQSIISQLQKSQDLLEIYEREEVSYEEERVKIYYLLYTSYINLKKTEEVDSLCTHLESKLKYFNKNVNYQEILWIIVSNTIKTSPPESQQALFKIFNNIETRPSIKFYKKAFDLLKSRDKEKCLFKLFKTYSVNSPRISDMIDEKKILEGWQNLSKLYERQSLFDFISMLQELIYFLGRDRLNSINSN